MEKGTLCKMPGERWSLYGARHIGAGGLTAFAALANGMTDPLRCGR